MSSHTTLPSENSPNTSTTTMTSHTTLSSENSPNTSNATMTDSAFKTRLEHLLQSRAFNRDRFSRTKRHGVKRMLQRWNIKQTGIQTLYSPLNFNNLKLLKNTRTLPVHHPRLIPTFRFVPSSPDCPYHCLRDNNGNVLAYRFRYPEHLLQTLQDSYHLLPSGRVNDTIRGNFPHRHYALWADYSPDIMQSSEYRRDHPMSQSWLDTNKELFDYISHNLRMINPEMYTMFTSIDQYLPADVARMAGAWHGVAINECMTPNGTNLETHVDWKDVNYGYNAVLPWGDFGGGNLIFWQAKVVYEMRPGDCLFFMGSVIAHGVSEITSGERFSIDLFCHKSAIDWKKRKDRETSNIH